MTSVPIIARIISSIDSLIRISYLQKFLKMQKFSGRLPEVTLMLSYINLKDYYAESG